MKKKKLFPEMFSAIEQGNLSRVQKLFSENPKEVTVDTPMGSWLHVAANYGQLKVAKFLIWKGMDIDHRSGIFGGSAINEAACEGHLAMVKMLLKAGAELDTSESVRNPLFGAILCGSITIVKVLIDHGIDYRISYTGKSMKNMDAEAFARERGQLKIAEFIADLKRKK